MFCREESTSTLPVASMRQLLEAGVHFGHQTRRWNPKMRQYIYGERNGIYIIDLEQTSRALDQACDFLRKAAAEKKNVVFVGTKKQAADIVEEEAKRCGSHFVNRRWLGGMLTNFETIRARINRLRELEDSRTNGDFFRMPKKEQAVKMREYEKLSKFLGGLKNMRGRPDVIVVVDQRRENTALLEAKKLGITTVVLLDTDGDPDGIDYVVPANDDSVSSVRLLLGSLADAILRGAPESKDSGGAAPAQTQQPAPAASKFVSPAPAEQTQTQESEAEKDENSEG